MHRPDPYGFEQQFSTADRLDELFVPVFMITCLLGLVWLAVEIIVLLLI